MRIAIVDCESTGLSVNDEPVSIGAIVGNLDDEGNWTEVIRWSGLQQPTVTMARDAEEIHGLTADILKGQHFDISTLKSALNGVDVFVSHYAAFDARMLEKVIPGMLDREWRCTVWQWPWPTLSSKKLDEVCSYFGIHRPEKHDALGDANALLQALNLRTGKTSRSMTYLQKLVRKKPALVRESIERSELTGRGNGYGAAGPGQRIPASTGNFGADLKNIWIALTPKARSYVIYFFIALVFLAWLILK